MLVINITFAAVRACHTFLKMALKACVILVRIASAAAIKASAAHCALFAGFIVYKANSASLARHFLFQMAFKASMIRTVRAHTAAFIALAAYITQISCVYTAYAAINTMAEIFLGAVLTHFAVFAELCGVCACLTDKTVMLNVAISAAVSAAVITAGADIIITAACAAIFAFHVIIPGR